MRAALALALRSTTARLVFAVGVAGLVLVLFRAVRPLLLHPVAPLACGGDRCLSSRVYLGSSPRDLAAAALVAVVALVAAALIHGAGHETRHHHLATFRTGRSRSPGADLAPDGIEPASAMIGRRGRVRRA